MKAESCTRTDVTRMKGWLALGREKTKEQGGT